MIKYSSFILIFLVLVSCKQEAVFDDEYKYKLCIQLVEENISTIEDATYIIDSEIREFRFNDYYIRNDFKNIWIKPADYHELSKLGFQKIDFDNAFLEHDNLTYNLNKLSQFNNSRNVIRFSNIKCDLVFMDVIKYCEVLNHNILNITEQAKLPVLSYDCYLIKFDLAGNATYTLINGIIWEAPCVNSN